MAHIKLKYLESLSSLRKWKEFCSWADFQNHHFRKYEYSVDQEWLVEVISHRVPEMMTWDHVPIECGQEAGGKILYTRHTAMYLVKIPL